MWRSLRSALARFTVRRAAACQRYAPKRAGRWLRLGCALAPAFAAPYPALVRLRRAIEDRWGALAAAQEAAERFAGDLYRRAGRHAEAAARFARAYAAGGGAEALWLNAQELFRAGDVGAADEALHLWATQVPDGLERLSQARAELFATKRGG